MNPSKKLLQPILEAEEERLRIMQHEFVMKHIPRLHRLLMEKFPQARTYFNYSLATNQEDRTKLTLLRGSGKHMRVLARNFTL